MASTDTPGRGSFRGVPFLVYQEQRERGGRNIVRREYPLRESGGADDLGPKLPEFTFTVLVTGDDLQTQRSRLRDALCAPGAGELMHPDYGTLNVLINSFESRYNASEQGTVEFTINVIPASDDTAPAVAEDTAAALEQKSGSAMNQLFNTLSDGWTVISDGLHDVQAMTDTISDKIDALENAVSGMGIVQDISAFTASFTALKGNAAALINAPRRMAESLAGMFAVLTGLPGDPSLSLTGKAGTPSGSLTTNRDSMAEQAMPQLYRTLSSLRYTLSEQDDPQRLIGLTPAAQKNIRLLRSVMQSATLVSQAQTLGKLLDQVIRQNTTHVQDTDRSGGLAWLESSADVQRINRDLSDAMEQQVLDLSAQGYTGTALALRDAGLALTEDLTTRSVHLPGAFQVMVRTTEPALVTLYRATGNSSRWQYFVRRNNIPDPVFVPGGRSVEVISEQQD
ncbi:DNA circularization protein [Escherichia coli]|uniref:DNA circularization protein n=1 Tax=Escherichia coli TaxID=562 RepID=UPI0023EA9D25|nr:DNA circularization N-terminal domain-containing protein [Escherichia coli]EIM4721645.1 DNA circularization protein [Escherichia coli]EJC2642639.1 DNA circularization protein [Escherichia coli]EJC2648964.1 DNA circularization protein [Escherichia coli]MDF4108121.1 DNA circularization N-terminal domain-containing protein [Escherichia coli]MDF4121702.1 DNA circularization N-terminal domain-containing protein [Escherichia coli]